MKNYQVIFIVVLLAAGISLASFKFACLAKTSGVRYEQAFAKKLDDT